MSVLRKISDTIVDRGLVQSLRDGELFESNTWEGSLAQVQEKFEAEKNNWQTASAQRNGPNIVLTLERTLPASQDYPHDRGGEETIEVIWREVMLPIRQIPSVVSAIQAETITADKLAVYEKNAIEGIYDIDPFDEGEASTIYTEYVKLLQKGITEFPSAVPVVRRTTSRQNASQNRLGLGQAYIRDEPPTTVPGDWEWLKTSDERRRDGRTYTQVEEWTGGKELSTLIYP